METARDAADQLRRSFAQFARQLQHHVAAQRESREKRRCAPFRAQGAQHGQQIAGKSGVVERVAEAFGAAAGPHVETVRGKPGGNRVRGQPLHVVGLRRSFESVHHHDLARGLAGGALGEHRHLHPGLGGEQAALFGILALAPRQAPVMSGDGLQMRIADERLKGSHGAVETCSIDKFPAMRTSSRLLLPATALILCAAAAETARRAPEFQMLRPGAPPLSFSRYRGKILAVAFIDTACAHCQELTKTLSAIARAYAARGVQVLECAFNEQAAQTLPEFIEQFQPPFPVGYAYRAGVLSFLEYSILDTRPVYVPHMVFIDRRGIIQADYAGEDQLLSEARTPISAPSWKAVEEVTARYFGLGVTFTSVT